MKSIFVSKTFWFGVLQCAVAVSVALGTVPGIPANVSVLFGATGIITIILRSITTQPVNLTGK